MENSRLMAGEVHPGGVKPPAAQSGAGPPHSKESLYAKHPKSNLLPQTRCFGNANKTVPRRVRLHRRTRFRLDSGRLQCDLGPQIGQSQELGPGTPLTHRHGPDTPDAMNVMEWAPVATVAEKK